MNKLGIKFPTKRIFILDELSVVTAFILALIFRYGPDFWQWTQLFEGLYVSFFFVLCMLQAIVFLGYDGRKKAIFLQDPAELLASVIKGKLLLIVMALFYLYINQRSKESSRFVIVVFFALSIVIEFLLKMLYRKAHFKRNTHLYYCNTLEISMPFPDAATVVQEFKSGEYDEVLIHPEGADDRQIDALVSALVAEGIRVYIGLLSQNYEVRSGIVTDISGYASIPAGVRSERFQVFGVRYAIARPEEAVLHVMRHVKDLAGKYICFSNVHTSVMAREDAAYRDVLNGAAFVFPDGNPIAVLQQKEGYVGAKRVAGPDFMERMFNDTADGRLSHFFYGSTQETLDALKAALFEKYPGLDVRGMYSPPFRELTPEEDQADIDMINASGADIVWIGLGAPKQEKWMKAHEGKINGVMMGVGAGFNFHAGNIKRAPVWIQKIGFEWLYRLFQDPKRLFKRYFVTNVKFFWYLMLSWIKAGHQA